MKLKVKNSRYVNAVTSIILGVLYIGCMVTIIRHEYLAFYALLSIFLILVVFGFIYGVVYIKMTPDNIVLGSILRRKKILMRDVKSAELFQPTLGAIRIFGSGGFMGYWGIFKEGDIGRYYAFYGKSSDCFLVRMKNGDKYVLGCEEPSRAVEYINSQITVKE